jgi:hypothetical protein
MVVVCPSKAQAFCYEALSVPASTNGCYQVRQGLNVDAPNAGDKFGKMSVGQIRVAITIEWGVG